MRLRHASYNTRLFKRCASLSPPVRGLISPSGGPRGTRTHNLRIKSPQLCQLS